MVRQGGIDGYYLPLTTLSVIFAVDHGVEALPR